MRPIALLGLSVLLAGCVAPTGNSMLRSAVVEQPLYSGPPTTVGSHTSFTQPATGYGGALPSVPSGGLGAEAPMPAPRASQMPSIGPKAGTAYGAPTASSASSSAGQSITVPNGNGTSTVIHPDGTTETIPTPK